MLPRNFRSIAEGRWKSLTRHLRQSLYASSQAGTSLSPEKLLELGYGFGTFLHRAVRRQLLRSGASAQSADACEVAVAGLCLRYAGLWEDAVLPLQHAFDMAAEHEKWLIAPALICLYTDLHAFDEADRVRCLTRELNHRMQCDPLRLVQAECALSAKKGDGASALAVWEDYEADAPYSLYRELTIQKNFAHLCLVLNKPDEAACHYERAEATMIHCSWATERPMDEDDVRLAMAGSYLSFLQAEHNAARQAAESLVARLDAYFPWWFMPELRLLDVLVSRKRLGIMARKVTAALAVLAQTGGSALNKNILSGQALLDASKVLYHKGDLQTLAFACTAHRRALQGSDLTALRRVAAVCDSTLPPAMAEQALPVFERLRSQFVGAPTLSYVTGDALWTQISS